jgi:hypothetical protein
MVCGLVRDKAATQLEDNVVLVDKSEGVVNRDLVTAILSSTAQVLYRVS